MDTDQVLSEVIVFVCHPFASDERGNTRRVAALCRRLALKGIVPLAPQIFLPHFIKEETERSLALKISRRLLGCADEVWVYGDPTGGMRLEIAEAERLGIPVVRKELPPGDGESGRPPRSLVHGAV